MYQTETGTCTASVAFGSPAYFLIGSQGGNPTAVTLQSIAPASQTTWRAALLSSILLLVLINGVILRRRAA